MKRLISVLAILLCFSVVASAGPLQRAHLKVLAALSTATTTSGQAYTDDFDRANADPPSGDWTEEVGSSFQLIANELLIADASTGVLSYDSATDTVDQYCAMEFADLTPSSYDGLYFRFDGNTANKAYTVRYEKPNTQFRFRYCTGDSCTYIDSTGYDATPSVGDSYGVEVTGTGDTTQVKMWLWSSQSPPARGSWGTCAYGWYVTGQSAPGCTTDEAVTSFSANAANTGKQLGLYSGATAAMTIDNWMGGDIE